jgi:outer membrane protein OmpA-like peptidoglycan-associated protein
MNAIKQASEFALCVVLVTLSQEISAFAQTQLKLNVKPKQAYVFIDGKAMRESSFLNKFEVSPGDHTVVIANYGYEPVTRTVSAAAGETTEVNVELTKMGTTVPGPFGAITIKHADHQAVMLNGTAPDFVVGQGDEFNNEFLWKQELVVPPGTYQLFVQRRDEQVLAGPITVEANKRVIVDVPKGTTKTVAWPRGEKLTQISRFSPGVISTTVAVAKPTADLTTTAAQINCGDASQLKWSSRDAGRVSINPAPGNVADSGEQGVQPSQTTTYQMIAVGPGGSATSNATVNVNSAVQTSLSLGQPEVRFHRVGDKIVEQNDTALNWSAQNASNVSIDQIGTVETTGTRNVSGTPKKNDVGTIDETTTYVLTATNPCGGSDTKTATLHITGVIEPPPTVAGRSVFFPTDRPRRANSETALLPSEQEALKSIAEQFKNVLTYTPDAHLKLAGHADRRGPQAYNQPLSERRAQLAKDFLVQQGIPESSIDTEAFGKEKNLSADEVKQLIDSGNMSDEDRARLNAKFAATVLAYNRRVDVDSTPGGQASAQSYPVNSSDFAELIDRNGPAGPKAPGGLEPASQKEKLPN